VDVFLFGVTIATRIFVAVTGVRVTGAHDATINILGEVRYSERHSARGKGGRSLLSMQCYYCAETINSQSNRCRFCGAEITAANRIGLPSWYRETGQCGLSLHWILSDLEQAATRDTGHLVLRGGRRAIQYAYGNRGDRDASERMFIFHEFVGDRLNEVRKRSSCQTETAFLYPLMIYTMWLRSLLRCAEHWSADNLCAIADKYEAYEVDTTGECLSEPLRIELSVLLKDAADELRSVANSIQKGQHIASASSQEDVSYPSRSSVSKVETTEAITIGCAILISVAIVGFIADLLI
jgi:hypothetical protein